MSSNSANSGSSNLNTIISTLVQNPSTRSTSNVTSNIQNASTPVNLITNIASGIYPSNMTTTNNNNNNASASNQGQLSSSRLKVEDALSYLDKVKNQFAVQPQVYNHFLDIMKEFKSQSIDTQEVINRVSSLFRGHPDLIVGFNTFLPPGYKIEVSEDHVGYIQVTHPSLRTESIAIGNFNPITLSTSGIYPTSNLLNQDQNALHDNDHQLTNSTSQTVNALISAANTSQLSSAGLNLLGKTSKQQTLTIANNDNGTQSSTNSNGQPVEFNHAINYVNKIKKRFHQNPNVYKTFLEILHTYQKQQKDAKDTSLVRSTTNEANSQPIILSETEVYSKVAQLFSNHQDLITEFSQFLPDATQQPSERTNLISDILSSSSDALTTFNSNASNTTGRSAVNNTTSSSFTILSVANDRRDLSNSSMNMNKRTLPSSKSSGLTKKKRPTDINNRSNPNENHVRDVTGQNRNLLSIDEITFFDKVQKTLRSPVVFDNFLRCILLYTKRIVSRIELFELIQSYLGHVPELLKTFQELIDLREPGEVIIPTNIYDQNDTDSMISIDYGSCSQYGTSYRSVPRSYVPPTCSGRTQLCKEVLNDHCVLFPTFTDESSSVATRKTIFEEHMYKIEDERFELDIVMEVNLSAIRALENVQQNMNSLTPEQLNNFQLDDQLGGQSACTQRQAVQRIYGERANEIIDGLKRNPRIAVPIVLKRLKSKDEEWRESKKNFERFWKEQSEKYYLKSLDYMGNTCKNSDGRIIRNRHLLNEIENIKEERDQQITTNDHQPHLIFYYEDTSVLDDAASLIIFLVKRQMTCSKDDKQNIKRIMYQFLPDFLFAPQGELSDDEDDDDSDETENNTKRERKTRPTRHTDTNRRRNAESSNTKPRQISSEYQKPNDMFHLFFVNDNYYYFFRLHQLLCERLLKMFHQSLKLIDQENSSIRNRQSSTASFLRFANRSSIPVEEYYSTFLDMVRDLLEGNMDSSSYEDSLREMFGIHAYVAFTIDKIIQNCVRQLHAIVADESSDAIMRLYSNANTPVELVDKLYSVEQQNSEMIYQHDMETYAVGNRLFRICSFKNDHRVTTSLILIDSSDDEGEPRVADNGVNYVQSYLHGNTPDQDEAVMARLRSRLRKKPRFLLRNIGTIKDSSLPEIININNDYCLIDTRTLKRKPFHRAGFFFYKRGSFQSIKRKHKKMTTDQYKRFKTFYDDWSSKHLSDFDNNDSFDEFWLKTHRFNSTSNQNEPQIQQPQQQFLIKATLSNNDNDLAEPPYRHYQKYHIVDIEK